ncbi:MAG: hypothetical protein ACLSVD_06145 [Eggerthellaceae bacterium]
MTVPRAAVRLGQAVNRLLDRQQGERIAAEEAKRVRRDSTSHDIRTPPPELEHAQLLDGEQDELRARYLDVIGGASACGRAADQLYATPRCGIPTNIERGPVDVDAVLAESLASLYAQFKGAVGAGHQPEDEPSSPSRTPTPLRIFRNLAANALRYGSEAPRIERRGSRSRSPTRGGSRKHRRRPPFERFTGSGTFARRERTGAGHRGPAGESARHQPDARLEDVLSVALEFPAPRAAETPGRERSNCAAGRPRQAFHQREPRPDAQLLQRFRHDMASTSSAPGRW